ncbi:MAG: DsbA family protein [Rickettsiales bacterium]|jgi:protein-disulfide isomerase|nr:DsbA family protein [Rickettsiales bacterium]
MKKLLKFYENGKKYLAKRAKACRIFLIIFALLSLGFYFNKYKEKKIEQSREEIASITGKRNAVIFFDRGLYDKSLKQKKEYLLSDFSNDFTIGAKNAPVTMVDYSSFTCIFCRQMREDLKKIIDEYAVNSNALRYVFRPAVNDKTVELKLFLNCARDSGKVWELTDDIFNVKDLGVLNMRKVIEELAEKWKIEINGDIEACLESNLEREKIIYYQRENSLIFNVRKTPLLVINGEPRYGLKKYEELKKIIEEKLGNNQ